MRLFPGATVTRQNGTDDDPYHFATLDHDSESSTEHAQFRQYSSTQGQWMTPDPYDGSYRLGNPQSLNRYGYVLNNPLRNIDTSGLCGYSSNATDVFVAIDGAPPTITSDSTYVGDAYCYFDGFSGGSGASGGGGSGSSGGGSDSATAPNNTCSVPTAPSRVRVNTEHKVCEYIALFQCSQPSHLLSTSAE